MEVEIQQLAQLAESLIGKVKHQQYIQCLNFTI